MGQVGFASGAANGKLRVPKPSARWLVGLCLALAHLPQPALPAAAYPARQVTLVVPFPASGPADIAGTNAITRLLKLMQAHSAPALTDILANRIRGELGASLGSPVVLERRSRAKTIEGTGFAARAAPDGHTLLLAASATMVIYPGLYRSLPFDPLKSFVPVARYAHMPIVLVTHPGFPANTVQQLLEKARLDPGELNFASAGDMSTSHLAGQLFKSMTGAAIEHASYNGGIAAVNGVITAQVDFAFVPLPAALPFLHGGGIKALGIADRVRYPGLPAVPTISEAGVRGYEAAAWYAVYAPAGTPQEAVSLLNYALVKGLASEQTRRLLLSQGLQAAPSTPEELGAQMRAERAKWDAVVKSLTPPR